MEIILGHDVRIKVVFDYECPLLEPRILTNPHMIQTGHIWFFQLAVCFWVLGLPLFSDPRANEDYRELQKIRKNQKTLFF